MTERTLASWWEDAHGEVVLLSDATDAIETAKAEALAAARARIETGLAEALKEYDAGRIEVPWGPGKARQPNDPPSRFHAAWAKALLDHVAVPSDAPEKP